MEGLGRYLVVLSFLVSSEGALRLQMTHEVEMKRNTFNTSFWLLTGFSETNSKAESSRFVSSFEILRNTFLAQRFLHAAEK